MIRLIVIFIIILFAVLFSSDSIKGNYDKKKARYIFVVTILLILQSGLRNWAVGADTYQYYLNFQAIKYVSFSDLMTSVLNYEGKDPFYGLFQKLFQVFTESYQLYLLLVAIIFMTALGNFILKNTSKISHAVLAFVIYMGYFYGFFSITGIRQTLATAFLLWSFEYIKQRNLFLFIVFVLIASLFHISALIFFPLYFIFAINKPKLIFALSILIFPIVMVFKNKLAVFFVGSVGVEDRFAMYTEQYYRGGSLILTTFQLLLAIWALFKMKKVLLIEPKTGLMYVTFALALFFLPLQWVNPSAGRIAQFFAIIIMVWIPYLLDAKSVGLVKQRKLYYFLAIVGFIVITLFSIKSEPEYKFFWQAMELPYGY